MFAFDRIDAQRIAFSAAGALFFSALCVGAAVTPVQAGTPITAWQSKAADRLDRVIAPVPTALRRLATRDATVGVTVAPDGSVGSPTMIRSSGNARVDTALLRRVALLRLAPIPNATAARPVELRIALVEGDDATQARNEAVRYAAR